MTTTTTTMTIITSVWYTEPKNNNNEISSWDSLACFHSSSFLFSFFFFCPLLVFVLNDVLFFALFLSLSLTLYIFGYLLFEWVVRMLACLVYYFCHRWAWTERIPYNTIYTQIITVGIFLNTLIALCRNHFCQAFGMGEKQRSNQTIR